MDNEARCLAWQEMRRQRHCPSIGVLQLGGPHVERHLAACENCRMALEMADEAAALGELLLQLPLQQPPAAPPAPGDVRALRPRTPPETWVDADGAFYNPPLLLVLAPEDEYGLVRVAQIFSAPDLQAEGDIPLDFGLIAEAWNTYAVPAEALDAVPYAHVGTAAVKAVLDAAGRAFPHLDEYSPLFHFRCDECNTGGFFSLRLNAAHLSRLEEQAATEQPAARVINFATALRRRSPAGAPAGGQADSGSRLATLLDRHWSADSLPLAAAAPLTSGPQAARRIALTLSDPRLRGGAPQPCAAELRLVPLPGKTLCSITCRLDAPGAAASVAVRCGDAEPLEVRASWQEGELLLIDAVFAEETLSADDLRVAVLLSEER